MSDSSSPDEENSFIQNVKSKMTSFLPAFPTLPPMPRLGNWFHRPIHSGYGSAPMPAAGGSDLPAEDEPPQSDSLRHMTPPRSKRVRYTDPSRNHNSSEITPLSPIEKVTPQNYYGGIYELPPDGSTLKRPLEQVLCTERDAVEDIPAVPRLPSSLKRKSIFEPTGFMKDYTTPEKSQQKQPSTSMNNSKPSIIKSYNFGSPFYQGTTTYGGTMYGGSFTQSIKDRNIETTEGASAKNSPRDNSEVNMSYTSKRVMDLLENYSSPRQEAKRIPQVTQGPSLSMDSPASPKKSRGYSYKRQELYLPYQASLYRSKERRIMDITTAARQIFASNSSCTSSNVPTTSGADIETICSYNQSPKKDNSSKMKSHLTRLNRGENPLELPEPVQLPTAVLQIDKNDLPKFSFDGAIATSVTQSNSSLANNSVSTNYPPASTVTSSNNKVNLSPQPVNISSACVPNRQATVLHAPVPQWPNENTTVDIPDVKQAYTFSIPLMVETRVSIKQGNTESIETTPLYTFINPQIINDEKPKSYLPNKSGLANQEEPKKELTSKPTNNWQCSECWVNNRNDAVKCVCCSAQRPVKVDAPIKPTDSKSSNDWKCEECWVNNKSDSDKCICCSTKRLPIGDSDKRKQEDTASQLISSKPTNEWNCPECWVSNKIDSATCVCCSSKKPGNETGPAVRKCSKCMMTNNQSDSEMCEICEKLQMSKSIALPIPMPADPTKWKCQGCWVSNDGSAQKCVCCGSDNPCKTTTLAKPAENTSHSDSNENIAKESGETQPSDGATVDWRQPTHMPPFTNPKTDNKLTEIAKTQQQQWECSSCLVRNESTKSLCVCCYTERVFPSDTKLKTLPEKSTFNFSPTNTKFKFGINPETNSQQEIIEFKTEVEVKRVPDTDPETEIETDNETETNNNTVSKFAVALPNALDQAKSWHTPVTSTATFTFGIPKQNTETPVTPVFGSDISAPIKVEEVKQEPQEVPSVDFRVPASAPKPFAGYFSNTQEAPKPFGTFNFSTKSSVETKPAPFTFGTVSANKGSFTSDSLQSNEKKEPAPFSFGSLNENQVTFSTLTQPSSNEKKTSALFSFGSSGENKGTFTTSGVSNVKGPAPFTFGASSENKVTSQVTPSLFSFNNSGGTNPGNSTPMFATPSLASTSSISFGMAQSPPTTTSASTQLFPDPQFQTDPALNLFQTNDSTTSNQLFTATSTLKSAPVINPGFTFGSNSQTQQPQQPEKFNFSFGSSQQTGNSTTFTAFKPMFGQMNSGQSLFTASGNTPPAVIDDNTMSASGMTNTLGGAAPIGDSGMQQSTVGLFGAPAPSADPWGSSANNNSANMFGSASAQKPAPFTFGAPNPFNTAQSPVAQTQPLFGAQPATQPAPTEFGGGAMFQSAVPFSNMFGAAPPAGMFGTGAHPSPGFDSISQQPPQPSGFNHVFGFGNQGQTAPQQPQQAQQPQQPVYNFGGGMAAGVQFNIGSAPAPNGRRIRKAVRRIPR